MPVSKGVSLEKGGSGSKIINGRMGQQKNCTRIKCSTIWKYIVTGETSSKKLIKLRDTHPEVDNIINLCIGFRKMIHAEHNAPDIDNWLKEASRCKVRDIKGFAQYVMKDKEAVIRACNCGFNNALLEGTVNKTKAIKRAMFNRAKADVLRAKVIFSGMKWDWNFHPN